MALAKLTVPILVLISTFRTNDAVGTTEIMPAESYMGKAIIVLPEEENATVTVQCISFQNNITRNTQWYIQRPGENQEQILRQDLNDSFVIDGNTNRNLTITNITQDLDRAEILCGPIESQLESRFLLGFGATALLVSDSVISAMEGSDIMVTLEAADNNPFPPVVTFLWMHNGIELNSSERISLNDYNITITSVEREDNGEYQLNVSNNAGFGVGNFTLDVLFGPIATDGMSLVYFVPGITVTLVAFTDIDGNPNPSSSWTVNSTALSTDIRFNTSVAGQLSITNISSTDVGMYTCTLSNGISPDLSFTVELLEAVLPTMPQNVQANEVNATSARLTWGVPVDQGTFNVNLYRIRLVPSPRDEVIETSETDVLISELLPGTEYTVTVVAVISDASFSSQVLDLEGAESLPVMFNTSVTAPLFKEVVVVNNDGFINISWTFVHTGGLDTNVESVCSANGMSGSGDDLMLSCAEMNMCSNENLMGSTLLGPVQAGVVYTCTVTALNANGSDVEERDNITSNIGIPSTPEIVNTAVLPGQVVLTVRTMSPGGPDIWFNVTVRNADGMVYSTMTFLVAAYDPNADADLTVPVPNSGYFSFYVISFNMLGSSETVASDVLQVPGILSTSISTSLIVTEVPTTSVPSQPPSGGLSGGEVAGIVIAMLIIAALVFLVVLVVIYLYIKNRGGTYQVDKPENKSSTKVQELDVDIGTELQTHHTEESDKNKELQYADLEHFRKKEATPDDTMATPLATSSASNPAEEPVQYSVIQPQPPKSDGSQPKAGDASDATSI